MERAHFTDGSWQQPRFGRSECSGSPNCAVMISVIDRPYVPVPLVWDPALCNAPCCVALCSAPGTTAEGVCGNAYHRGRRVFGLSLFLLWKWRRGWGRTQNWLIGARAVRWYLADLSSLTLHPFDVQTGRANSSQEEVGACSLALGVINRCTIGHVGCTCFDTTA